MGFRVSIVEQETGLTKQEVRSYYHYIYGCQPHPGPMVNLVSHYKTRPRRFESGIYCLCLIRQLEQYGIENMSLDRIFAAYTDYLHQRLLTGLTSRIHRGDNKLHVNDAYRIYQGRRDLELMDCFCPTCNNPYFICVDDATLSQDTTSRVDPSGCPFCEFVSSAAQGVSSEPQKDDEELSLSTNLA